MNLLDVLNEPWAIKPVKLTEIRDIYITHLHGERPDLKKIEADLGGPLQNPSQGYTVRNGAAIIPIEGVIAKKMNLLTNISGGCSTQLIGRDFQSALKDPMVKRIILSIDSPGGAIDGVQELANQIYNARGQKPIIAHTDGMMASAAYWIGKQAIEAGLVDGVSTLDQLISDYKAPGVGARGRSSSNASVHAGRGTFESNHQKKEETKTMITSEAFQKGVELAIECKRQQLISIAANAGNEASGFRVKGKDTATPACAEDCKLDVKTCGASEDMKADCPVIPDNVDPMARLVRIGAQAGNDHVRIGAQAGNDHVRRGY